jgi:hypothetical protein
VRNAGQAAAARTIEWNPDARGNAFFKKHIRETQTTGSESNQHAYKL